MTAILDDRLRALEERAAMLSSSTGLLIVDLIRALRAERSALGVPGVDRTSGTTPAVRVVVALDGPYLYVGEIMVMPLTGNYAVGDWVRDRLRTALSRLLADARAKTLEECAKECEAYRSEVGVHDAPFSQGRCTGAYQLARRIRAMAARGD